MSYLKFSFLIINMAPIVCPSMDSCIPKYTNIKEGKDGDFAKAFKNIGIFGLFSKKKSEQKVKKYFERIGKTEDLEKVKEMNDYAIEMSQNPGYFGLRTITELKQEQKERREQIGNMKEIERENNRKLLWDRIYEGLPLVNVEKKRRYRKQSVWGWYTKGRVYFHGKDFWRSKELCG